MLYVHSYSHIEQQLAKLLEELFVIRQLDIAQLNSPDFIISSELSFNADSVLYSFQKFEYYKHLDSFQAEIKRVQLLVNFIITKGFKKIILVSYPGSYPYSDNLFLQHKGIIEQMFVATKIPCTILKVQGICNPPLHMNNFHQIFYQPKAHHYLIPNESKNVIYSTNILNLASIISKAAVLNVDESYDVFDQVYSLKNYLCKNSNQISIQSRPLVFLYFMSMFNRFCSQSMLELFIRPGVPMYNFRTEKAFNLGLHADIFEQLKSEQNRNIDNKYLFAQRRKLIPVT